MSDSIGIGFQLDLIEETNVRFPVLKPLFNGDHVVYVTHLDIHSIKALIM